jgi:hypothetical protein
MLTSALITLANSEVPDWSRVRILQFLNEIQQMIFAQNGTAQMRIYDPDTGLDPVLEADGSIEYNVTATDLGITHDSWRVYDVYQAYGSNGTYDYGYNDAQNIDSLKNVLTFDATPDTPYARIVFPFKASGSYYLRCYRLPNPLVNEKVQLEVPAAYHLSHVYEGLMGFIEQFRSGRSERYQYFMQKLLPDLVKRMSDGQRRNTETRYSHCGE